MRIRRNKMSKLLKTQLPYLRLFLTTPSKQQKKALLDTITDNQVKALTEITHNLLELVIPVTANQKTQLRRYKAFVVLLGDPKISVKRKKKAVCRQTRAITLILKSTESSWKTFLP